MQGLSSAPAGRPFLSTCWEQLPWDVGFQDHAGMEENTETIAYSNYTFLDVQTQINFPLLTVGCSVPKSPFIFGLFLEGPASAR